MPPRTRLRGHVTRREAEVVALMARGMTAAEIGAALGISVRTVQRFRENMYHRLGLVSRRPELEAVARWAAGELRSDGHPLDGGAGRADNAGDMDMGRV